eukprot:jgi/Botrbrau1/7792/Bobra.0159s0220.1
MSSPAVQSNPAPQEPTWYTKWTIPVGRIFGIPVRWHVLFLLVIVLGFVAAYPHTEWQSYVFALLLLGPVLLLTILVHELGHCLMTRKMGAPVHSILLWPLGGLAFVGHTGTPKSDLLVAIAGPLTHVPMFLIWFLMLLFSWKGIFHTWTVRINHIDPVENLWIALCAGACQLNIGLFFFNVLLPAYPLDGGRIFADLLLICGVDPVVAAKITVSVAFIVTILIILYGLYRQMLLTVAVGLFMLFPTFTLLGAIRAGTVRLHPMFNFAGPGPTAPPSFIPPGAPPPYPPPAGQPPFYGQPTGPATGYPVRAPPAQQARTDPNAALFAGHQSSAPV